MTASDYHWPSSRTQGKNVLSRYGMLVFLEIIHMKLFIRIPVPLKPFLAIYMETAKILSDHPGIEARIEFINGHVDLQLMASQWLTWEN